MNKWTNKKISFISVLIATSVAFTIIGAGALAITSLPNIKLSFAGLPVKITGYLFGPLIGFITGFLADLLSFLFIPSFYNPLYSFGLALTGAIPGIVAWFYFKFGKNLFSKETKIQRYTNKIIFYKNFIWFNENKEEIKTIEKYNFLINKYEKKIILLQKAEYSNSILNFNWISSFIIISILLIAIVTLITNLPDRFFDSPIFFRTRPSFYLFSILGLAIMIVFISYMRFNSKPKTFLNIVPIIIFSALIEFSTIAVIAYADSITLGIDFQISLIGTLLLSPIKIWGNLIIILITYNIIAPLIKNKQSNGWV
ncbi:hypothetical protein [[Mycoplasma] mobile]|uniref:Conserved hypothetical membrane protein n=1 Tax=Mycoplasma mobile (strain ATCC 43663 / 163K / NCTC 11711) TaxID=267748 RepID=Q6KID4_MYCM1|nr:hypothetical protein [[Mycoplasma] mobile]AAT27642.1 conserved hypothetical membrane protein [Mycoplasma mobile 163K]